MTAGQDLRFAARNLARSPGFAVTCVLVLSLGIAINTAAFSVVNTLIRRPLPFADSERIASVFERSTKDGSFSLASYPAFAEWRDRSRLFQVMGAAEQGNTNVGGAAEPESVPAAQVTGGFLRALGLKPILGRSFNPAEESPGSARVVLIGQRYWERRFGSDPGILGREITVDLEPATVIGVLPRINRSYFASTAVWTPLAPSAARLNRNARTLQVAGLLRPGATFQQAGAELASISRAASAEPGSPDAAVVPMANLMKHTVPMYAVLLTVVGLLLLIVCANVATLQLARAAGRQAEIAVRMALGANRMRIICQLLTEGLLLAGVSGAIGYALTALVRQIVAASVPELSEIRFDASVLGFTALISAAAGVFFGLSPAISASKPDLNSMLKAGGRSLAQGAGRRVRGILVVAEMTVAVMLLSSLGMAVRAFLAMHAADTGFQARNLVVLALAVPAKKYPTPEQRIVLYHSAIEQLKSVAGADAAAVSSAAPLGAAAGAVRVEVEGRAAGDKVQAQNTAISPEYLETLSIPLLRGRSFTAVDSSSAPQVTIVNQRAAELFWRGQDPVGRRVRLDESGWRTVVGVAADARQNLLQPAAPEFYVPYAQDARPGMNLVVRTKADPHQIAPALRRQARSLDRDIQISSVQTLDDIIDGYFPKAIVAGVGVFCIAALFIAALGLYGVVSYLVTQRTHEFGLRAALGASPREIAGLVLRQGFRLAGTGAALGLAAGAGLSRLIANAIAGVRPGDPAVFAAVALLLSIVTAGASYIPARRATRISPIEALRYE